MAKDAPLATRPHIPGYGIPDAGEGMLAWADVSGAFASAPRYWIATTDRDGAPHLIQQWGIFIDSRLYFEGGSETRWARNLAREPRIGVSVEAGGPAIMLEGRVERLTPDTALAVAIIASYRTKSYGYIPDPKNWDGDGLVAVRPARVFAWRFENFTTTATRFTFHE